MSEILEIQDKFQHDCRIASICIRGSRNSFGVNTLYAICSNSRVFHNIIVFHKYLEFLELYYYLRFQNIISILNFRSIRNIKSFFLGAFASGFGFNSFESCSIKLSIKQPRVQIFPGTYSSKTKPVPSKDFQIFRRHI